jgi:hypothetical protein
MTNHCICEKPVLRAPTRTLACPTWCDVIIIIIIIIITIITSASSSLTEC